MFLCSYYTNLCQILNSLLRSKKELHGNTLHIFQFLKEQLHINQTGSQTTYLQTDRIISYRTYDNIILMSRHPGTITTVHQYKLRPLPAIRIKLLHRQVRTMQASFVKLINIHDRCPDA